MTEWLSHFRRFDPPRFDGSCTEPWIVESWMSAMEKLFEDLFIQEREQDEFYGMLYEAYFSTSVKQKLEEDLKKLQQGERSVQEYTSEFTRLLNCVPFVARDEAHKVYLYEGGLRPEILQLVQAQRLRTLDSSIEQALWVERGEVSVRQRAPVPGQSQDRKRPAPDDGGQTRHIRQLVPEQQRQHLRQRQLRQHLSKLMKRRRATVRSIGRLCRDRVSGDRRPRV
uniref:Retrotransposon gag domain-containing protein n=1 Tax=Ananas comosus var. bracteatus TaxID=296719 RepID=A0A6V7PRF7_ANACO|nr:unnamed protein product [Ananas comosus var. bracteatus]